MFVSVCFYIYVSVFIFMSVFKFNCLSICVSAADFCVCVPADLFIFGVFSTLILCLWYRLGFTCLEKEKQFGSSGEREGQVGDIRHQGKARESDHPPLYRLLNVYSTLLIQCIQTFGFNTAARGEQLREVDLSDIHLHSGHGQEHRRTMWKLDYHLQFQE